MSSHAALALPEDLLSREAYPTLMNLLTTLSVRHDELGQEIVLNHLLANLIHSNRFDQAELLVASCSLTQPYRSTNQAARFFYYVGLTAAMRLDYSAADSYLAQALRKAPERVVGFRIAATKLHLVVQLLIGEIPARSEFLQPGMKEALQPYLLLTSCVRFGNLGRFQSILQTYQKQFEHDRTYTLITRVRHNVIKTALRHVCQAYSRISLQDTCEKLALENPEDVEYITAKAIHDGVVDASIDHAHRCIVSSDSADVYRTNEPIAAFQKRIAFCTAIHNDARRSMRYSNPKDLEDEEARKRAEEEDRQLVIAIEEGAELEGDDDDEV